MTIYIKRHLQVLFNTLGDMRRTPSTSLNTLLIIAITLLLPCLLYVVIKSAQTISSQWSGQPQISIFMRDDISSQEARLIFDELRLHPAIELAEFISPKQALEEFKSLSGLESELAFLDTNPLPASIVILPNDENIQSNKLLTLKKELSQIDGIDKIRLDLEWTDRFNAILKTVTDAALLLSALLICALILIVSNAIKLLILNRRHEIEITKLVGGTDAFVRRPFLYYGTLFGVLGAFITLLLMLITGYLITPSLNQLTALYQAQTLIYSLKAIEVLTIIVIGGVIGWVAARWSVAQHLRHIKPK